MTRIVFPCCSRKEPRYWEYHGQKVELVASPRQCDNSTGIKYQRPDDPIGDTNKTWRDELESYNRDKKESNPLELLKAWQLYKPRKPYEKIYRCLVEKYGEQNVFILSAGWGLVRSDFLLPHYDITFSSLAKP
jgi:hypothetical protein